MDLAGWLDLRRLILDVLARIERAERTVLTELGCPTDAVSVYAILNRERPAPWPKRTDTRDRQRAQHAMWTLAFVDQTRAHLVNGRYPQPAAYTAVLAGIYAGDAARNAVATTQRRRADRRSGTLRGKQLTKQARREDRAIKRLVRQWELSDELQFMHRSPAAYVHAELSARTNWSLRTVQRHLDRLKLSPQQSRQ